MDCRFGQTGSGNAFIRTEASMSIKHMVESISKKFWFFNWEKKIRFNHFTIRQNRVMDKFLYKMDEVEGKFDQVVVIGF